MSKLERAGLTAGVAIILAVGTTAPAQAREGDDGSGGNTGTGYEVEVQVTLTGDGSPGGGGSYSLSIPPLCWWEPIPPDQSLDGDVDASDPQAVYEWFKEDVEPWLKGHAAVGRLAWPGDQAFLDAIAAHEAGADITWYRIASASPEAKECSPNVTQVPEDMGGEAFQSYAWFVTGDQPEPEVDPEDLAIEARDVMEIAEPEVDRNPKLADGSAATFVNVPTWFWVTDPEMVGGDDGERTIRAEVQGSSVWAEVTARTGGLSIASPAGSRMCEPGLASVPWSAGVGEASGCTIAFSRASVAHPGGYPVSAATEWTAIWEGQEQDGTEVGGDLDPLQRSTTVNVPVAEVQSVVQGDG